MTIEETELLRQRELARIDGSKTLESRRAMGQFATPPELARDIAKATTSYLKNNTQHEMLEPSAGNGSFLTAFLKELPQLISHITAIELDPVFFDSGTKIWAGYPVEYRNEDFTKTSPDHLVDFVVANPPYVRHHFLDTSEKKRLQREVLAETGLSISGLAGLYCHFLLLSLKWMKKGAVGVWLIPTEWMTVNYGSSIRKLLSEKVRLLRIHRFDAADVRFSDALVSSCIVWFQNEVPGEQALFTEGSDLINPVRTDSISISLLKNTSKWPPSPNEPSMEAIPKLRDYFTIRRGIATGDNSFFVLSEKEAEKHSLPREYLKPILPSPRFLQTDWIESDNDGVPVNTERLFLFDCTGHEQERLPASAQTYLSFGEKTTSRKKLCAARQHWFDQEQRSPAPILCSYMGRSDGEAAPVRFILNESQAIATNSYLMLFPKGVLQRFIQENPKEIANVWITLRTIPAEEFKRAGRCYGGGLQKMEPHELGDLDCTSLHNWLKAKIGNVYLEDNSGQLLFAMEGHETYKEQFPNKNEIQ